MKSEHEHVYGIHPVLELLQAGGRRVESIFLLASRRQHSGVQQIIVLASHRQIPVTPVAGAELRRLLGHDQHQGVAAVVAPVTYHSFADLTARMQQPGPHTLLVLDGVTDVGNFATLIRSAAAFGVEAIVLPKHHSVGLSPVVAKRSAGAIERVAFVQVGNLVRALETLQQLGCWLYGAEAQGEVAPAQVAWPESTVLVMGAEGRGMRRLVRQCCDHLVRIPMQSGVDSINVAVAGSILLSHIWAQREAQAESSAAERRDGP